MTGKKKPAGKDVAPKNPSDLSLSVRDGVDGVKEGMTQSELMATVIARSVTSAPTLKLYSACGDGLEVQDLVNELRNAGDEVVKGDLARMERMLVKQAMTLDAIFNNLAQKSHRQEYMKQMETYLRLALKAQSQSRATAEALALMKNPMPYIRQANISGGAQQVNNGPQGHAQAQQTMIAETSSFAPNKLLEGDSHARMDIGAQSAAGRVNTHLATVGALNRPGKCGR